MEGILCSVSDAHDEKVNVSVFFVDLMTACVRCGNHNGPAGSRGAHAMMKQEARWVLLSFVLLVAICCTPATFAQCKSIDRHHLCAHIVGHKC